jgi:hypothetical protein
MAEVQNPAVGQPWQRCKIQHNEVQATQNQKEQKWTKWNGGFGCTSPVPGGALDLGGLVGCHGGAADLV